MGTTGSLTTSIQSVTLGDVVGPVGTVDAHLASAEERYREAIWSSAAVLGCELIEDAR